MTVDDTERLMALAAARAEENPYFVASSLASYRALRQIDNTALAAMLKCTATALAKLALCRRPEGEGSVFRAEVERIAQYVGCDATTLAGILRAASLTERLNTAAPGALLAARDRTDDPPSDAPATPGSADPAVPRDAEP